MVKTFFIADTHFNHTNIIKYCSRPFSSIGEMNDILIQNWNACVSPPDVVYHLGDFGFGNVAPILKILNGTKILIIGNHDQSSLKPAVRPLFDHQTMMEKIKIKDKTITLCHYSMRVWPGSGRGAWHLYGHSHGVLPQLGKSMDVGVDATKLWRPLSFEEIEARMSLL
jgi:calcineurin-like phosphoesterase family protein